MAAPNTQAQFDEAFYLLNSPDVKAAVLAGTFQSGWDHFSQGGKNEPRKWRNSATGEEGQGAVTSVQSNSEYITGLYRELLDREPDAAGLAHWVRDLDNEVKTRNDARAAFLASDEYKARTTPTAPPATTFQGITSLPVVGPIVVQIGNAAVGLPVVGGLVNSAASATGWHPGTIVVVAGVAAYFIVPMLLSSGGRRR